MAGQNITVFIYAVMPEIHKYIPFFLSSNNLSFDLWHSVFTLKKYTLLIYMWKIVHPSTLPQLRVTLPVAY